MGIVSPNVAYKVEFSVHWKLGTMTPVPGGVGLHTLIQWSTIRLNWCPQVLNCSDTRPLCQISQYKHTSLMQNQNATPVKLCLLQELLVVLLSYNVRAFVLACNIHSWSSQPPIVQVHPPKKTKEAFHFHHRYTSNIRDKIKKRIQKMTWCDLIKIFANYGRK